MNARFLEQFLLYYALGIFILCVFAGCDPATKVTSSLSPIEVARITDTVHNDLRRRSDAKYPITSIELTTKGTVEVWYSDREARWGAAGYTLARAPNGWKITAKLFQ